MSRNGSIRSFVSSKRSGAFIVPSDVTGRIQESHITAGHGLMEYVEDRLIEDGFLNLQ